MLAGALRAALLLGLVGACSAAGGARSQPQPAVAEAGFVELEPRSVELAGRAVSLAATSRLFYNFRPADEGANDAPVVVLFNGFAADVVRGFGTGPTTVLADGSVVNNPDSLTRFANLLYLEPRQAGFSYDIIEGRAATSADCGADVFNEYVDAADVLLGTLRFLRAHASLRGPLYFLGESYAGVRIQWLLAFVRGAWSLAPYRDELLQRELTALASGDRLLSGQILLEPWLVGAAQTDAVTAHCQSPGVVSAFEASVGQPCALADACRCARDLGRSLYNYTLSNTEQDGRIFLADAAQVSLADAEALYGVRLENVPELAAAERARGFKCSVPDASTPDQSALFAALGPLPQAQVYALSYSPLTPGKGSLDPDWTRLNLVGAAFVDNLGRVDTLVTDGARDLVAPEPALGAALEAIGVTGISETASALALDTAAGVRTVDVFRYGSAGHMITMIEPHAFASDFGGWLRARAAPP